MKIVTHEFTKKSDEEKINGKKESLLALLLSIALLYALRSLLITLPENSTCLRQLENRNL
jgi:hypothetical protein